MKFDYLLGLSTLVFTPKALHPKAQGCGASPLPWAEDDATLSGLMVGRHLHPGLPRSAATLGCDIEPRWGSFAAFLTQKSKQKVKDHKAVTTNIRPDPIHHFCATTSSAANHSCGCSSLAAPIVSSRSRYVPGRSMVKFSCPSALSLGPKSMVSALSATTPLSSGGTTL